jgi:hypothetical protein
MMDGARERPAASLRACGTAAFAWGAAFGLLNVAWAVGIDPATDTLSPTLTERFEQRRTVDIAILAVTGIAKIAAGLVPMALPHGWWAHVPRRHLERLCWAGGMLLALYGLGDIASGTFRAIDGQGNNAIWYAVLWGPVWLIWGVVVLGTAWSYRRARR